MAYKPITDQQLRLYMTDIQKHSQRTSAARAGLASGQIQMRKVDGWETLTQPIEPMSLDLVA